MKTVQVANPLSTARDIHTAPVRTGGAVQQMMPALNVSDAARAALASMNAHLDGVDDMAMSLGHRIRNQHQSGSRNERGVPTARRILAEFAGTHAGLAGEELMASSEEFAALGEDDLQARIANANLTPGALAFLLASLIGRSAKNSKRRQLLQEMLDAALAEDGWQLDLLGLIEFGGSAAAALPQLKVLYREAQNDAGKSLSAWFSELRGLPDRRRKLMVLIRTIGFDLSSQGTPVAENHLASVIIDLKRLLIFLGLDEQCTWLAAVSQPPAQSDDVLALIVDMISTNWIYEGWLRERIAQFEPGFDQNGFTRFCFRLKRIIQGLPEMCFQEDEQRTQIVEALLPLLEMQEDEPC